MCLNEKKFQQKRCKYDKTRKYKINETLLKSFDIDLLTQNKGSNCIKQKEYEISQRLLISDVELWNGFTKCLFECFLIETLLHHK